MRRTQMRLMTTGLFLCIAAAPLVCLASEPSKTLALQGSENIVSPVNADPVNTALRMTVVTSQQHLKVGQECEVRVEIRNTSATIEIVYMPGLRLFTVCSPSKKDGRPDEYGPPMTFGRMGAKDERLNFVVLMADDCYARTYSWTPLAEGTVTFEATYRNRNDGTDIGVKTWTGELHAASKALIVSKGMVHAAGDAKNSYKPKDGYVPDAQTAIAIAVAAWNPIFGKDQIAKEKPYKARLSKGIWTVEGSLREGAPGGVAAAQISKDDGRILRVVHGQ